MTSKPDVGVWIAGATALVIIGAIVAGISTVSNPNDARAQRLDSVRLTAMDDIATAAQCAYTYTNAIPASIQEIRAALREHPRAVPNCTQIAVAPNAESAVAYEVAGDEHINLCADFLRASPPTPTQTSDRRYAPAPNFPELEDQRSTPGRHCFRVRLAKQM